MSTGQNIVDEVRAQLNDEDTLNFRWSDAEMLRYVNAGQRQIVAFKPTSNIIIGSNSTSSSTEVRQVIPAEGIKFISAFGGDAIEESDIKWRMTRFDLDAMNAVFPEWSYPTANQPNVPNVDDIYTGNFRLNHEQWAHDPREPRVFWVYPMPGNQTGIVGFLYVDLPTDMTSLGITFRLSDEYQNAMVLYVMYRCLRKDGRHGGGVALRASMWEDFRSALGMQQESEARVSPETPANRAPTGP